MALLSTVVGTAIGLAVLASVLREINKSNEEAALQQVEAVQLAQWVYARQDDGFFGDPDCLVDPSHCLSDYQPESHPEPFLEPAEAFTGVKDGYRFVFVPGPVPNRTLDEWKTYVMRTETFRSWKSLPPLDTSHVPDAYIDFAYLAIPVTRKWQEYGFCTDASGIWSYEPQEVDRLVRPFGRRWSQALLRSKRPNPINLCPESFAHSVVH